MHFSEINGIGGFASLPSLIFDAFSSSDSRRVRTVNMRQGQIQKRTVFPDQPGKQNLPFPEFTPFPVMVEYSLVTGRLSGEEMTYRQMFPLFILSLYYFAYLCHIFLKRVTIYGTVSHLSAVVKNCLRRKEQQCSNPIAVGYTHTHQSIYAQISIE